MWQRSHEIICLYISSKPAKGLGEKSGIFGYIDSLWLLVGLKRRAQATGKKKRSLKRCLSLGRVRLILPSQGSVP